MKKKNKLTEETELTQQEKKGCKKCIDEMRLRHDNAALDFLQQFVHYDERGIRPEDFCQKAHLGKNLYYDVVKNRGRRLTNSCKLRLAIGLAIFWENIMTNHITCKIPMPKKPEDEENYNEKVRKKEEQLKQDCIKHFGKDMQLAFELKEQGKDLDKIARYLKSLNNKQENFKQ